MCDFPKLGEVDLQVSLYGERPQLVTCATPPPTQQRHRPAHHCHCPPPTTATTPRPPPQPPAPPTTVTVPHPPPSPRALLTALPTPPCFPHRSFCLLPWLPQSSQPHPPRLHHKILRDPSAFFILGTTLRFVEPQPQPGSNPGQNRVSSPASTPDQPLQRLQDGGGQWSLGFP